MVNDEPKHMVPNFTQYHHAVAILSTSWDSLTDTDFVIPLSLDGVTSYFPICKPSLEEWENSDQTSHQILTAEDPDWVPNTSQFSDHEAAVNIQTEGNEVAYHAVVACISSNHHSLPLKRFGKVPVEAKCTVKAMKSGTRQNRVGATLLAKRWGIGIEKAQRTIDATTQRVVRTTLHDTLSRRFKTNDRQLRYRRLPHNVFTDTMQSSVTSWHRRNKYAQIFCTRFGWSRAYPMRLKSEAHEGLLLMAQHDGVPIAIIMDGSKEQTLGPFRKKCAKMGCHVRQTEPHSPWQNAAEGAIRELKKSAGCKAVAAGSLKQLWDHCIELMAYIRSHTAIDSFELHGQVPETIMSGQTADISPFVELGWYDWVKYWDLGVDYPEPKEQLGRWLGPAIDVGPAMCSKILKQNGQVIYVSTYRSLTEHELSSHDEMEKRKAFTEAITEHLGGPMTEKDTEVFDADTPTFVPFNESLQIPDIDHVTPEEYEQYIGAEVLLPFKGHERTGKVQSRAQDQDGCLIGKHNTNPILDSRAYEVVFPDGEVAEYAANVIALNMYSLCNPSGNQYLMLKSITGHKTGKTAYTYHDPIKKIGSNCHYPRTTKGWQLCVEWKDGMTT